MTIKTGYVISLIATLGFSLFGLQQKASSEPAPALSELGVVSVASDAIPNGESIGGTAGIRAK